MKCYECDALRTDDFKFCLECGAQFPENEMELEEWEIPVDIELMEEKPNQPEAKPVNFCLACGNKLEEKHRFCGQCGTPRGETDKKVEKKQSADTELGTPAKSIQKTPVAKLSLLDDDGTVVEYIPIFEGENEIRTHSLKTLKDSKPDSFICTLIANEKSCKVLQTEDDCELYFRIAESGIILKNADKFKIGETKFVFRQSCRDTQIVFSKQLDNNTEIAGGPETAEASYLEILLHDNIPGNVYRIDQNNVTIGRTDAEILIKNDPYASSLHAEIIPKHPEIRLVDKDSSNGTYAKIKRGHELNRNDIILLDNQLLILQ